MALPPDPLDGRISQDKTVTPELTDYVPILRPGNTKRRRNQKALVSTLVTLSQGETTDQVHCARFGFYGINSIVEADSEDDIYVPMLCRIDRVTILCDQAATAEVDVWVAPFADFPPTVADTICGGNTLTISAADSLLTTSLVDWTRQVEAGSVIRCNVVSNDAAERLIVQLDLVEVTD